MRSPNTDATRDAWPPLPYEAWKDTYATLHRWAIAFLFTPRGLRTRLLSHDSRTFSLTFGFIDHQLVIETSDGVRRALLLTPRSVAEFYHEWMTVLDGMGHVAVTRFSGRPAPPRDGPAFMRDAYSHEVISHGFWPGSPPLLEPAFYAYAVPEPTGLKTASVQPEGAYYHHAIAAFVDTTYNHAATLAGWDRAALERPVLSVRR